MNKPQKTILAIGLLLFLLAGIRPPWFSYDDYIGHRWVFDPANVSSLQIDLKRLLIIWFIIAVLTAGGMLLTASKERDDV